MYARLAILIVAFTLLPLLTWGQAVQELHVGVEAIPATPDPATALEGPVPLIARQVFETLVQFRDGTSDVEPALATQWRVSRDGLAWTFVLRSGVRFHNGTPLTAQLVAASFERLLSPDHPSHPNPNEVWPRLLRGVPGVVKDVRALDAKSVQIRLVQPYAPLLTALAHPGFSVVLTVPGEGGATKWLGTGPYRIQEVVSIEGVVSGRIVLEANPDYWGEPPSMPRIVLVEVGSDAQAEAELNAKTLDLWFPSSPPREKSGAVSVTGWRVGLLAMQTQKPPFSRKPVRRALAAAIDPVLLFAAIEEAALPLQSFLPPGVWGRRAGPQILLSNAEGAKQLLAGAGFREGVAATLLVPEDSGVIDHARVAEAIQRALDPAGIALTIRREPREVVTELTQRGEHELVLTEARVGGGDPHLFLYPLSTSEGAAVTPPTNLSFYRNPRLDSLLIRASQLGFRPERLRLYQHAQAILADELPWIPLYVHRHWAVARPEVQNLHLHPSGFHRLDRITLGGSLFEIFR